MTAIYKKEMRSYLTSPVGYVFLAVFFALSGYYFFATSLVSNTTDMSYVFSNLFSIVIFKELSRNVEKSKPIPTIKAVDKIIPIIVTTVLFLFDFKCLIVKLFKMFI